MNNYPETLDVFYIKTETFENLRTFFLETMLTHIIKSSIKMSVNHIRPYIRPTLLRQSTRDDSHRGIKCNNFKKSTLLKVYILQTKFLRPF